MLCALIRISTREHEVERKSNANERNIGSETYKTKTSISREIIIISLNDEDLGHYVTSNAVNVNNYMFGRLQRKLE